MECEKIQERISCLVDGELSLEEESLVKAHMASCEECKAMYEAFAAVSAELQAEADALPADLHETILAGVKAAARPKKGILVRLRPYMGAAACLVLIVALAAMMRSGRMDTAMSRALPASASNAATADDSSGAAYSMPASAPAEKAEEAPMSEPAEMPETTSVESCDRTNGGGESGKSQDYGMLDEKSVTSAVMVLEGEERSLKEIDRLWELLAEKPEEDILSCPQPAAGPDAVLCLETEEGSCVWELYFQCGHVYVIGDSGKIYRAAGSVQDFQELR